MATLRYHQKKIKIRFNVSKLCIRPNSIWDRHSLNKQLSFDNKDLSNKSSRSSKTALFTENENLIMNSISEIYLDPVWVIIMGRVKSLVSDSQAVMTCAAANIGIWSCECILHMLHTLLGSFIDAAKPLLNPIFKLAGHLSSSTNWTAFASQREIGKIPSFTPIRWSSMLKTFQAINLATKHIIKFSTTVKKQIERSSIYTILLFLIY